MLLREPFTEDQGRSMLHPSRGWHLFLTFVAPMGFSTRRLAYMLDSLVRVSRRVSWSHFDKISTRDPQAWLRLSARTPMFPQVLFARWFPQLWPHFAFRTRKRSKAPLTNTTQAFNVLHAALSGTFTPNVTPE